MLVVTETEILQEQVVVVPHSAAAKGELSFLQYTVQVQLRIYNESVSDHPPVNTAPSNL